MRFNIRVYGILIKNDCVLVSDELIKGTWFTKFPGGGLEFGEGLADCLQREFMEELNWPVTILNHFYTTDFFVPSAFDNSQIISVYYLVESPDEYLSTLPNNVSQKFRWLPLSDLNAEQVTLIIDKHVAQLLQIKSRA